MYHCNDCDREFSTPIRFDVLGGKQACPICMSMDFTRSEVIPMNMYHCEICGESGSFVREVESILCNAHAQMVGRTLNELTSQNGATVTVVKTPADAALAELLETVFQCEADWRESDRFDSFGRYGG